MCVECTLNSVSLLWFQCEIVLVVASTATAAAPINRRGQRHWTLAVICRVCVDVAAKSGANETSYLIAAQCVASGKLTFVFYSEQDCCSTHWLLPQQQRHQHHTKSAATPPTSPLVSPSFPLAVQCTLAVRLPPARRVVIVIACCAYKTSSRNNNNNGSKQAVLVCVSVLVLLIAPNFNLNFTFFFDTLTWVFAFRTFVFFSLSPTLSAPSTSSSPLLLFLFLFFCCRIFFCFEMQHRSQRPWKIL